MSQQVILLRSVIFIFVHHNIVHRSVVVESVHRAYESTGNFIKSCNIHFRPPQHCTVYTLYNVNSSFFVESAHRTFIRCCRLLLSLLFVHLLLAQNRDETCADERWKTETQDDTVFVAVLCEELFQIGSRQSVIVKSWGTSCFWNCDIFCGCCWWAWCCWMRTIDGSPVFTPKEICACLPFVGSYFNVRVVSARWKIGLDSDPLPLG